MNLSLKSRIRLVFIGISVLALILISSLYSIQIVNGEKYAEKANAQYGKPANQLFNRGNIYFQSKDGTRIAAATVEYGNIVFVNPKITEDPEQTVSALKEFLDIDEDKVVKIISEAKAKAEIYKELAYKVDDATAESINALKIKGVGTTKQSWRSYPGGFLAAHTLGLVGQDQSTSTIRGKYGIERSYEDVLSRTNVGSTGLFAQLFAGASQAITGDNTHGDIVTTVEPTVQAYLEKILSDTYKVWHPDIIGGVVINPQNGEIIALASIPTFNGNDTSEVKSAAVFSNPLVEHVYEMGSILKPLTIAMGLDSGTITTKWTYEDTGSMTLNTKKISNFDGKARGRTNLQDVLSHSLNVGVANIALKAGNTTFATYFEKFGFGERTGIDLPNEATGLIGNVKTGKDIDIATASYGQGIAMSPISVAKALSILANGGYVVEPHIVKEIDYTDGSKKVVEANKGEMVLKKETTDEVTKMLVEVVDTALKKGAIKNERYSVAAKTGTAQIADRENGGYEKDKYLHSFFGYFPAYDPEFLVFLYQVHPKGAQFASETLTEPFDNMTKFLINYYDVPPDR